MAIGAARRCSRDNRWPPHPDRTAKLTKGAKKYATAIDDAARATDAFSGVLSAFCGGADEASALIGGPLMLKFVGTFKELASYHE